ncbi:MAG: hypothetical protein J5860_03085 [Clostridia bacterium]|nr:hypothetical protein [Clostridia bacterium]MBO4429509.1 hypothetical protein [Clostridia bacterium]
MWWIPVVAAVAAILALILFSPVKIRVFTANGVNVTARYLIFKRELYPAPPKKEKKKKPKEQKKKEKPKKEQTADFSNVLSQLKELTEILKKLLVKLKKRLRITLRKLYITVGSDEAAKTAMIYGAVCVACDELLETMKRFLKFRIKGDDAVGVNADFTSEKISAETDAEFSMSVISALTIVLPALAEYTKQKDK